MEYDGLVLDQISPKAIVRQAFATKYLDNAEVWLKMIGDRNLMSHTYDFSKFEAILRTVQTDYLPILDDWHLELMEESLKWII